MDIARQFVDRVGNKLQKMKVGAHSSEDGEDKLSMIPDGQTLLLRPKVDKYIYDIDLEAIKQKTDVYFLFKDFVSILKLEIDYDEDKKHGHGSYLIEDWPFSIDVKTKKVISRDKSYAIADNDILIQDGKLYVASRALGQWLSIKFKLDLAQQYVDLNTPYPLPAVAKYLRDQRKNSNSAALVAQLPRKPPEYSLLDINAADVTLNGGVSKSPAGPTQAQGSGSVAIQGQALQQNMYALFSGNDKQGLQAVTARLSKEDENPILLGPLKARSCAVGDVQTTDIPLTGQASQALGFHVSNSPLNGVDFQTTNINGDGLPGWDVELYRDGLLINHLTIAPDGRYEFPNTELYAGDNNFELFFYGPQGQIRNQKIQIPVTEELLVAQKNTYDFSGSLTDRQSYTRSPINTPDKGTPDFAGRYNTVIGNTLVYGAFRNRQIEGEDKTYGATGFTKIWHDTLFDGNFGLDNAANIAAQISARKNIDNWRFIVTALHESPKYSGGTDAETLNVITSRFTGAATKTFKPFLGDMANFSATTEYDTLNSGGANKLATIAINDQFGSLNINNAINYQSLAQPQVSIAQGVTTTNTQNTTSSGQRIDDSLSVTDRFNRLFVRAGFDYELRPDTKPSNYFSEINYAANSKLTGDLYLSHTPDPAVTDARLSLNYLHDYFYISPFIDVNTERQYSAGVSLNFDAVRPPHQALPVITSRRLIGKGGVSSFVYLDKNGDDIYDGDDEPLPNVIVQSVNVQRRVATNAKGYSLIDDLPDVRATDIRLDPSTLPDPYMISDFAGVSIFPSPGELVKLEFPIHMAGEMDGKVLVKNENGIPSPADDINVQLIPVDGRQKKIMSAQSADDGYYDISLIPPGVYLLTVEAVSARQAKAGAGAPQLIEVGYNGPTITGQNIALHKNTAVVPISTRAVVSGVKQGVPLYALKIKEGGKSELLNILRQMSAMRAPKNIYDDLVKLSPGGVMEGNVTYYRFKDNDLDKSFARCQAMADNGIPCEFVAFVRDVKSSPIKTASLN